MRPRTRARAAAAAALLAAVLLAGCSPPPPLRPAIFDRAATSADLIPTALAPGFEDARAVASWHGATVYLAIGPGGSTLCLVIVSEVAHPPGESAAAGCADDAPFEAGLNDVGVFRYDLATPDRDRGWEPLGNDVYGRLP